MHPDLEVIVQLDAHDEALKRLDAALARAKALVPDGETAVKDAVNAQQAAQDAVNAGHAEAGRLSRDVSSYEQRRSGAIRALEMGTGDPDAAERQIAQVIVILDELETKQLENMERQEDLADDLEARKGDVADAEESLAEARKAAPPEIERLQRERDAEQTARDAYAELQRPDLNQQYGLVRKRKKRALVHLDKHGACDHCYTIPPPGQLSDARRGVILLVCAICQRYIVPS